MTNSICCSHNFASGPLTHTYTDVFNLSLSLIPQDYKDTVLMYDAKLEWIYNNDWIAQLFGALSAFYEDYLPEWFEE